MTNTVMITITTKSSPRQPSEVRCDEVLGAKNAEYIDLSSIKKSFENCKSAVLAVKRLAGDNIQPLFTSRATGDGGSGDSSGAGGGGTAAATVLEVVVVVVVVLMVVVAVIVVVVVVVLVAVVGGFLSGWLTGWIVFLLSLRPSFLSLSWRSEGWRGTGMRIRLTVGRG